MSIKTTAREGQLNRYEFSEGGKHTHDWYDSKTGVMGSHGENASIEDKKWSGDRTRETMSNGNWTKGVK